MKRLASILSVILLLVGCKNVEAPRQRISLFVGIDVSGSYYNSGRLDAALDFLSYYLYGHLNECGDLKGVKALFVGSIGGDINDEAKSFHPIQDFEGKSREEIRESLGRWFPKSDANTDFNAFFKQVALIAQKRNLSLSPLAVVLITDGLPDLPGKTADSYESIDVSPLEYTSRNVTIRLLDASPVAANKWETVVPRKRVRMWTVDNQVMAGWRNQINPELRLAKQTKLWAWVSDNVDFRVQPTRVARSNK